MVMIYGGDLIKKYRKLRGITQEQLSEGICNTSTIQRIESGKQTPGVFIFMRLIERLGFESKKFFVGVFSKLEFDFFDTYYKVEAMTISGRLDGVDEKIEALKQLELKIDKEDGPKIREQMILALQISADKQRSADAAELSERLLHALSLTMPNFDEQKISDYMISSEEISLLNMLSASYGDLERRVNILYGVKKSMDKYYLDKYEKSRGYTLTLYNLSSALGYSGRHKEALEVCNIAIKYCVDHKRLYLLPHLKFNKACALFYLGDTETYKQLVVDAIYALRNNEDYEDADIRKAFAENELKMTFCF